MILSLSLSSSISSLFLQLLSLICYPYYLHPHIHQSHKSVPEHRAIPFIIGLLTNSSVLILLKEPPLKCIISSFFLSDSPGSGFPMGKIVAKSSLSPLQAALGDCHADIATRRPWTKRFPQIAIQHMMWTMPTMPHYAMDIYGPSDVFLTCWPTQTPGLQNVRGITQATDGMPCGSQTWLAGKSPL